MDYLTVKQTAETLQLSERTIRQMIADGTLPASKVGKAWRIRRADLERVAEARPRQVQAAAGANLIAVALAMILEAAADIQRGADQLTRELRASGQIR